MRRRSGWKHDSAPERTLMGGKRNFYTWRREIGNLAFFSGRINEVDAVGKGSNGVNFLWKGEMKKQGGELGCETLIG